MKINHLLLVFIFILASCNKEKSTDTVGTSRDLSANTQSKTTNDSIITDTLSIKQVLAQLAKKPQSFSFDASEDKTIVGKEGTKITITANTLVSEKTGKPVSGKVSLKLTEYYKISDMLIANLSTTSDGKLLETGGMINVEAYANGEKLKLKKGAVAEVLFPTRKKNDGMQLFNGEWGKNGGVNWKLANAAKDFSSNINSNNSENNYQTPFQYRYITTECNANLGKLLQDINVEINYSYKFPKKALSYISPGRDSYATVSVGVLVMADGSMKNIRVLNTTDSVYNEIALVIATNLPKWKPAIKDEKPIQSEVVLAVKFNLVKNKQKIFVDYKIQNPKGQRLVKIPGSIDANSKRDSLGVKYNNTRKIKSVGKLAEFVFVTSGLGWLNSDRFYVGERDFVTFKVYEKLPYDSEVLIICKKSKGIFNSNSFEGGAYGFSDNSGYTFKFMPSDEPVTIIIFKKVDGINYIAIKDAKTTKEGVSGFLFKPIVMKDLKKLLQGLDK